MRAARRAPLQLLLRQSRFFSISALTEPELAAINRLVPRLLDADHLQPAIHLVSTAVLANPPLSSLLSRRRHKDAARLLSWLRRPECPHRPDGDLFAAAIRGFCGIGRPLEALNALREMAEDGIAPGRETRMEVYRRLLMEARVEEARELKAALEIAEEDRSAVGRVKELVDGMIENWEE